MIPQEKVENSENSPSSVVDHSLVDTILDGVDFGIAVFDAQFNLIRANDKYFLLCKHEKADTPVGTPLRVLMERVLHRQKLDEVEIASVVSTTLLRLKLGGSQRFLFRASDGRDIVVTRRCEAGGQLVETIHAGAGLAGVADGTDRLRILAETAHSRMTHALDAMSDGFALFDSDDQLMAYNQKYIEMNAPMRDLIKPGARFEELLREGVARDAFDAPGMDGETYIHWRLQQHFNPGEPHEHQVTDGRWIRTVERPTSDGGIVGIHSDITELRAREQELARLSGALDRTNDHFNEALNNMVQGLCMFGADQRLILCNRQYLEMYGFSDEVVRPGILISDIMRYSISLGNYRDEDAQAALNARHDPDRLKQRTTIKQYLRDERVIAVMNEPMANGGTIATYQDITAMEQHEVQLLEHSRKLEISNRELQDFAYVASHDLQEPLRKIEAFSDRLVGKYGELLPDDGKMYIDRMQNAAFRMRQLINDLLSYSRVTTNAKPFKSVDIAEVLDGVISDLQMRLQDSNGIVEYAGMPRIVADNMQMRQLFQNLISNALKFKKPDVDSVVTIKAEKFTRQNEFGTSSDFWRFFLADNGIGFENKYKDQIFTIFQRLHGRLEYEGTGIGLATCRKIVERHSGSIDADGLPGVGATFIFELPANQEQEQEQEMDEET